MEQALWSAAPAEKGHARAHVFVKLETIVKEEVVELLRGFSAGTEISDT